MGKGGGAPSEVSTITIPKYAQPYMEKLLGQTEALTETPIASYTGERIAGPTVAPTRDEASCSRYATARLYCRGNRVNSYGGIGVVTPITVHADSIPENGCFKRLNFNVMECRPLRLAFDPTFSSIR
jgi:hypothetical protein